jgi:hypothetical protein
MLIFGAAVVNGGRGEMGEEEMAREARVSEVKCSRELSRVLRG